MPEQDLALAVQEMKTAQAGFAAVAHDLHRDRTERRRSDTILKVATIVAVLLALVDLVALGFIISQQNAIRDVQHQSTLRGKRIEATAQDTHRTSVSVDCLLRGQTATPDTTPAGRQAAIDAFRECVKDAGEVPPPVAR
jgi:hypothetical protein